MKSAFRRNFGIHVGKWFEGNANYYSRPLSRIRPKSPSLNLTDKDGHGLPTFALFTFTGTENKISRLALYLDRFKFVERLGEEEAAQGATQVPSPSR